MIRKYLPKKTSFENLTEPQVLVIEKEINNYPREILNFSSSNDVFN